MHQTTSRRPLAFTDLMIAVALAGLAFSLITRPIQGRLELEPNLLPPAAGTAELLLRVAGFAGLPLLTIAWHRRRGRRGILAGFLAGIICYGGYILAIDPYLPHYDLDRFPQSFNFLYFSTLGATHGLILGLTAWGLAALASFAGAGRVAWRQA
ncbi:MAG: hypothetical protein ACLQGP_26645 [Isosphaeraceae bacterium]